MVNRSLSLTRRVFALVATLANVAFNYVYTLLPLGLPDMKTASDRYPNLFTPAPYAFSIWGAIYLSWIVYTIIGLLPSRRNDPQYDRASGVLILLNLLGTAWILEFVVGNVGLAQVVIVAMLGIGWVGFLRAQEFARSYWGIVPFSLFLGWITVANFANLAALLTQLGSWQDIPGAPVFIVAAGLAAIVVGFAYREPLHPLVVAWATLAIGVKAQGMEPGVATPAFAVAGLSAAVAAINAVRRARLARR